MLYKKLKSILLYRKVLNYLKNEFSCNPSQNTGSLPSIPPAMPSASLPSAPPTAKKARAASPVNMQPQMPDRSLSSDAGITDFLKTNYSSVSFSQRLNLYMYERDITTATIYKRCFVDRKLISKITSSDHYHPSKQTVFALCIALRLSLAESEEFLNLAGYAFSFHSKYDLIIKFLLDNQVYSIDTVNDVLFHFHEPCFGGK